MKAELMEKGLCTGKISNMQNKDKDIKNWILFLSRKLQTLR